MRASPAARKFGPSQRSPIARSIARAVHGASGVVMVFRDCTVPELLTAARSAGARGTRAAVLSGDGVVGGEMRGEEGVLGGEGRGRAPAVEQELIRGCSRLPGGPVGAQGLASRADPADGRG